MDFLEYKQKLKKEIEEFKQYTGEILLFGTLSMGSIAYKVAKHYKKNVVAFCDNNPNMQGKTLHNLEILPLNRISKAHKDAVFYICSYNKESIATITNQLKKEEYTQIYTFEALLYLYWFEVIGRQIAKDEYLFAMWQLYYPNENNLNLRNVGLIITEKCSLKCVDCGSLINYFDSPINYDKEEIIEDFSKLSGSVDAIESLGVYGGEPFLHPHLEYIISHIMQFSNIKTVNIVTNGTIVPKNHILEVIAKLGIILSISDYCENSKKLTELVAKLEEYNIVYEIIPQETYWYKSLPPKKYNRGKEANKALFSECFIAKKCPLLQKGKLYLCGYHASVEAAGLYKEEGENLQSVNIRWIDNIRGQIAELFLADLLDICDYCTLAEKITVKRGVQLNEL